MARKFALKIFLLPSNSTANLIFLGQEGCNRRQASLGSYQIGERKREKEGSRQTEGSRGERGRDRGRRGGRERERE